MSHNKNAGTKYSIPKIQEHAFQASVENAQESNISIKAAQNWLCLLVIAEMTFLGTLILNENTGQIALTKTLLIGLVISSISFLIGSIAQYKGIKSRARKYEDISNAACRYLKRGINEVSEIPKDLKLDTRQIVTDRWANEFFMIAFLLMLLVNIGIIYLIIKL